MKRLWHVLFVAVFFLIIASIPFINAGADQDANPTIEQTFQKAKRDYLDKNMQSAAEQIKKGAAYMNHQASAASAKGKDALAASARELDVLADDVKNGLVSSPKRMEEAFARAYLALAENEHVKATESWAQKKRNQAGEALDSANRHLEKSFAWAGQKVEKGTAEAMKKSDDLAHQLKKKGSLLADEVGKGIQSAGNEIDKLGKKISPR